MNPSDIVRVARTMIGVRFRHGGRSRLSVDCAGLIVVVGRELGIDCPDEERYSRIPQQDYLQKKIEQVLVKKSGISAGDVLLFWMDPGSLLPQHVAIATSEHSMIHAHAPSRKVVEIPVDRFWLRRLCAAYSWPGV